MKIIVSCFYIGFVFIVILFSILRIDKKQDKFSNIKKSIILPFLLIILATCFTIIVMPKENESNDDSIVLDGVIYEIISSDNYTPYYNYKNIDENIKFYEYYCFDMLNVSSYPAITSEVVDIAPTYAYPFDYYYISAWMRDTNNYCEGTYGITGYTDDLVSDVVIPKEINGISVTNVGYAAFENAPMNSFTSNAFMTYHPYCVSNCPNLEEVSLFSGSIMPLGFSYLNNVNDFIINSCDITSYQQALRLYDASIYNSNINKLEIPQLVDRKLNTYIGEMYPNYSIKYPLIHDCEINEFYTQTFTTSSHYEDLYFSYKWVEDVLYTLDQNANVTDDFDYNYSLSSVIYIRQTADSLYLPIIRSYDEEHTDSTFNELSKLYVEDDKFVYSYFDILLANNDKITIYIDNTTVFNKYEVVDNKLMLDIYVDEEFLDRYEVFDFTDIDYNIVYIDYDDLTTLIN